MARIQELAVRYPLVVATLAVGVLGLGIQALGHEQNARLLVSVFAGLVAAKELVAVARQLLRRSWGLDLLAVTAIISTLAVGEYWASLVVVLMVTGGAALEDYAVQRAQRALTALLRRTPRLAHRIGADEAVTEIAVDAVVIGDRLRVLPGETVPVDAVLESAEASFDESALTGESLPVSRATGERLLSGAANGGTVIEVRAVALARDSEFQQIVALVESASNSKAPFVRLADAFAVPFTLVAYAIAAVAWIASGDPVRFAEVLVVATPCPLLIAAPVAFIAGMNRAAKVGVIVRSGGALEQLARVKVAAFDKTGTLTLGTPVVERIEPAAPFTGDRLLALVASVEAQSSHVLAAAIVRAATGSALGLSAPDDVRDIPGKGVTAVVDGRAVAIGKLGFVVERREVESLEAGEMAVYAAVDGVFAGRVVLRDETRANARAVVEQLTQLGIERIMMLTGDGRQTADHVARQVGIDEVHASLLPAEKVSRVAAATPRPVLMVGDGVNDAPVLAAADVGIAMGARGSTAASETADVVILLDDLGRVVEVVRIARRTVAVAVQSIWVGIGLSVVLMVIAAFGLIPAIIGATLQEVVDVATIVNGLRAASAGRQRPAANRRPVITSGVIRT